MIDDKLHLCGSVMYIVTLDENAENLRENAVMNCSCIFL